MRIQFITRLFPVWAILFSIFAYYQPSLLTPLQTAIYPLLILIMFSMGMTLTLEQFRDVIRRPGILALGVLLQYSVMPLAAWLIANLLELSTALTVGMLLVGSAPGGTASNVICYLARGNVALSVSLTMLSTLLAFILTPALVWLYIGEKVPVPVLNMFLDVMKIVLIPVLLGTLLNTFFGKRLRRVQPIFPLLSMLAIIIVIAIVVALNQARISTLGGIIVSAVILHNLLGLTAGYWVSRLLGFDRITCRTLAIETGMQNSGLSVALAIKHFSAAAALPGALFSIWHNLSGSLLAGYWSAGSQHQHPAAANKNSRQ